MRLGCNEVGRMYQFPYVQYWREKHQQEDQFCEDGYRKGQGTCINA